MNRAVIIPFHQYTPFGHEFYQPLLNYQLKTYKKYRNEYDQLYLIDSEWGIPESDDYIVLKKEIDGHHWVQFKWAIPKIKEENMLFMDNDVLLFDKGIIDNWFKKIEEGYEIATAFDGSGDYFKHTPHWMQAAGWKRMGSYYFILTKKLLSQIPNYDFAPIDIDGKHFDSFGLFTSQWTKFILEKKVFKIIDHRNRKPSDPYFHIRAGSTIPYLLASKHYGHEDDYWNYLKNQPKEEYLRQCRWYRFIGGDPSEIEEDSKTI